MKEIKNEKDLMKVIQATVKEMEGLKILFAKARKAKNLELPMDTKAQLETLNESIKSLISLPVFKQIKSEKIK